MAASIIFSIFNPGFDEGIKSLGSAAMTPSGMAAATTAGTGAVIQSQEEFERQRSEDLLRSLQTEQSIGALFTEIFRLYYTTPTVVKTEIEAVLGIGEEAGEGGTGYKVQIAIDERIKSLIIKANREDLDSIAKLIERIDIRTRQVLIEAFIVEASDDFSKELGARLGVSDDQYFAGGGAETITTQMLGIGGSLPEAGADITLGDTTGLLSNFPVVGGQGLGFLVKRASTILKTELTAMEKLGITKIISKFNFSK